jgi:hypothetical protein
VKQFTLLDGNPFHFVRGDAPKLGFVVCARRRAAMVERNFTEREDRLAFLWLSAVSTILVLAFILTA